MWKVNSSWTQATCFDLQILTYLELLGWNAAHKANLTNECVFILLIWQGVSCKIGISYDARLYNMPFEKSLGSVCCGAICFIPWK